ncbi:hypothetical protein F2Q68_00032344 [Brassica cretica]|uniref:Uncharacterized protein n=1 Tax=Brassica cretica TaxID=69181 RepID=A0A8S9G8S0_BRACR|nr:hypothetical protein F2Q68_00032344 [Brassica cretica]
MAVGNPVMQRMLSERRAALGMPPRDPQESDPTRQQPSNPTNYFDNMLLCHGLILRHMSQTDTHAYDKLARGARNLPSAMVYVDSIPPRWLTGLESA